MAITRHFWLCCREDIRNLRRISALWDFLRESAVLNREFLLGEAPAMRFATL
ncbi:hypothetical protein BGLA2_2650002 [Burkholderia gladioli]|nr:hypothetical protein BGLA2_2650002 [Burkholderia gladioli]